jgi:hypothetical protein
MNTKLGLDYFNQLKVTNTLKQKVINFKLVCLQFLNSISQNQTLCQILINHNNKKYFISAKYL